MKRVVCLVICLCLIFSLSSCFSSDAETYVFMNAESKVKVDDVIVFQVRLFNFQNVKTIGIMPIYDQEYFEFSDAKMLVEGVVTGTEGGVGVVAFSVLKDMHDVDVFEFSLRAKQKTSSTEVSCKVSVIGEGDVPIDFEESSSRTMINVKIK